MSSSCRPLFVALGVVWGIPYLLIKVAVDELSPAKIVLGRTAIAALILLPLALAQGAVRPVLQHWRWLRVFALVEIAIPWVFLGTPRRGCRARPRGSWSRPCHWPGS